MSWWDCASGLALPGPQRLIRRIEGHLRAGQTAVVVFPKASVESGLADQVIRELESSTMAAPVDMENAPTLCAALLRALRIDCSWGDPARRWLALADTRAGDGTTHSVTSWEYDISELLRHWPTAVHARTGATPANPMNFLVGVRYGDYPSDAIDGIDRLHVAVTWWYGAITRLDSRIHVDQHSDGSLNRLQEEAIVEICGWDLDAATALIQEWDGDFASLGDSQFGPLAGHGAAGVPPVAGRGEPGTLPTRFRDLWDDGRLDLWDGSPRPRPSPEQVNPALWRAQCSVLLPRLEEQRRMMQQDFWRHAHADAILALLNEGVPQGSDFHYVLPGVDEVVLELGQMHFACSTRRVSLPDPTRRRLSALRDVRNALAHGQPAPSDRLRELEELIR